MPDAYTHERAYSSARSEMREVQTGLSKDAREFSFPSPSVSDPSCLSSCEIGPGCDVGIFVEEWYFFALRCLRHPLPSKAVVEPDVEPDGQRTLWSQLCSERKDNRAAGSAARGRPGVQVCGQLCRPCRRLCGQRISLHCLSKGLLLRTARRGLIAGSFVSAAVFCQHSEA